MAELEDEIRAAAAAPKNISHPTKGSVQQHSLADLVAASEHLAAEEASTQPHFGLRRSRAIPPGCGN